MEIILDKNKWDKTLHDHFPFYEDIYFQYNYHKLWANEYNMTPELLYYEQDDTKVFFPHLVNDLKYGMGFNTEYFKYTSPYGYGGFLSNNGTKDFFKEYPYTNEFIRFHPIPQSWKKTDGCTKVNDIAVVDLENIWINKGHRYNIKKSKERGCKTIFIEKPKWTNLVNFINLYTKTMIRCKANERYLFGYSFIENHFKLLDCVMLETYVKNDLAASSIFLKGEDWVHYHLAGSNPEFSKHYPNDNMINSAMIYFRDKGYKYMILGGGKANNDSLFKFKKGFTDLVFPFYIKKIQ